MVAQIVSAAGAGGDGSWRSAPAARQRARGAMYATRCLAQALVCSCAAGEGGFHTGLSLLWAIAPPRRSWNAEHRDWHLLAGAPVCAHRGGDTAHAAWRLTARRPRGDRDQRADQLPSQPPPFPLAATTPQQCCANSPRHQAREGCATSQGGRRPCLVVRRAVCRNRFLGKKTQKQRHSQPQK